MSCVNGYCEFNDTQSCTGGSCTSTDLNGCVCNWGLCVNAACTNERVNSFDCASCTRAAGDCLACCDSEGEPGDYSCFPIDYDPCSQYPNSRCNGGCDERLEKCCLIGGTAGADFTPKSCGAVAASSCASCCPYIETPCESRTQTQCAVGTTQCGWCGGSCVNLTDSHDYCGSCTNACAENYACENSVCVFLPSDCELRSQIDCDIYGDDCRWCPSPAGIRNDDFSTYPYLSSEQLIDTYSCVGTSSDPFNCGSCGFNSAGMASYSSSGGGFCDSYTPFCINGNCVGRSSASCSAVEQMNNPFYFYNVIHNYVPDPENRPNWSYYTYSSQWCSDDSGSVYSVSDYDQKELICSQITGGSYSFSGSYGCCGDNKCRVEEGDMCGVTALCDGTNWRTGADSNGMVFDASCSNYPIANINGEFIKCVDSDRYANYSLLMNQMLAQGEEACNQANTGTVIDYRLGGVLDYSCGNDRFSYSTIALLDNDADACKMQRINSSSVATGGTLVCTGWGDDAQMMNTYGFVSLLNRTVNVWDSLTNEYAQCPASPTEWVFQTSPEFITSNPPLVMPCPGNQIIGTNQVLSAIRMTLYGGESPRAALFCKTTKPAGAESLSSLNYVNGAGTVMGTVNNRDYMCYTSTSGTPGNRARIAVCCGTQGCSASTGIAEQIAAGDTITINGNSLACQDDGSWSSDLDYEYAQSTCTSSGYFATGTYCCSEPDDSASNIWIKESYNQLNGPGGCFKGTGQTNNRILSYNGVSYPNVYVANGSFYGCGFGAFTSEFNQGNQNLCQPDVNGRLSSACLHSIENWPDPGADFSASSSHRTRDPLINRASYCSGFNTPGFLTSGVYCAYNNTWSQTSLTGVTRESTIPAELLAYFRDMYNIPSLTASGCCNTTTCWGPNGCHQEQLAPNERYDLSSTFFYKCIQGEWVSSAGLKTTPDGCESGVCPYPSQCVYRFVNVSPSRLGCVDNGRYVGDFLCNGGSWISRTKVLASKLANLTQNTNKFVLMCGPPKDSLVNMNTSQSVGNSNNFCVLNLNGQRIIGTTLNQEFYNASSINTFYNNLMWSFNNIYQYMADEGASFDFNCDETSTNFIQCMGSGSNGYLRLYYDKTYQMVIFSNRNINGLTPSFGDTICSVLPRWLQWLCPDPPPLTRDLEGVKLFNKIYAAKNGTKQVFGVSEGICGLDIYSFNYTGYLKEELMPLILYPDEGVFKNFTSDNTIFISKSENDPWDPWASLTILRNLEQP